MSDTVPVRALVGREAELASALRLLMPEGPAALALLAPPGQGKTALVEAVVDAAVEAAREPGGRMVLTARPLETEATVAFSGLGDLLSEVGTETLDLLPAPQRSAVRAALLLEAGHGGVEPRAVAAGVRHLLQGAPRGVLLVVDDAQWLDPASSRAVEQAIAHTRPGAVRLLVAARPEAGLPGFVSGAERLELAPLTEGALFHVVKDHLGTVLDRGALRAVRRASGGNPLHALELVRSRQRSGTTGLHALVEARVSELARPVFLALLASALADTPTVEIVAAARQVQPGELLDLVEAARESGLIVVRNDRIGFAHPLFASGVVATATRNDVRETHLALVPLEPDPDLAVRHRALGSTGPDDDLADSLDVAADRTWTRGGWDAACDLGQLAVERTGDDLVRFGRMLRLGRRLHLTGRPAEAERLLTEVRRHASGEPSWEAGVVLGQIFALAGRLEELRALIDELERTPLPPRLAAEVRLHLSPEIAGREPVVQLELLSSANALLEKVPDDAGLASDRAAGLTAEFEQRLFMGERRADVLDRAAGLERREPARSVADSWLRVRAHDLLLGDRQDEARTLFHQLLDRCAEVGDDLSVPTLLAQWARLEDRAGRWDRAAELLEEGRRSASAQGQVYEVMFELVEAKHRSLRGDPQGALGVIEAVAPTMHALEDHGLSAIVHRLTGEMHLVDENPSAAWTSLARAAAAEDAALWRDPGGLLLLCDYVDAALAVGEVDAALERTALVRARAEQLGERENVLASCEYARLAVLAATGDLEAAVAAAPGVVAAYAGERCVLERGRALLLAGRVYRRAKAKRRAAAALAAAGEVFAALPCPPYLSQTRGELARVGLRPAAPTGLTATEGQVARLAADGLRNQEIADRAFVSTKTVEATLTRVYRKLGIRSRAELGRALDAAGTSPD